MPFFNHLLTFITPSISRIFLSCLVFFLFFFLHVSKSTSTATTTCWTLSHDLDHSEAFLFSVHVRSVTESKKLIGWSRGAITSQPRAPAQEFLMRPGRTFLDHFAIPKLLERSSRSPPVVSLIEPLQDESAKELISQSMTPVFEWLKRGNLGCADVYMCVCVCVLGLRPKYTELHRCCCRIMQSLLLNIVEL